jgi:drug/metabolite transporter (DMT)-like permease
MGLAILGMIALSRFRPVAAHSPGSVVPRGMRYLADRPGAARWRVGIKLAVACGVIDSLGNTLQLLGLRVGELSVMSVLNAMYPAGTILLAALVMRERITRLQGVGLALALLAAALFALS